MKKLQINYTNIFQSGRLLKMGVPAWSADCTQEIEIGGSVWHHKWIKHEWDESYDAKGYQKFLDCEKDTLPCWSVGRLIEIYNICVNLMPGMQLNLDNKPESCTYIELIISSFELAKDDGLIDFSKLEE